MSIHDGNLIWPTKEEGEEGVVEGVSGPSTKDSSSSSFSMCSSDLTEDASSSFSSNGPFDDLSDLISQLPIIHVKKGLSKYYKGKSQSFTSLANVTSLTDLVKRRSRMKPYRSSGGHLNQSCKRVYRRNTAISMKAVDKTFLSRINAQASEHSRCIGTDQRNFMCIHESSQECGCGCGCSRFFCPPKQT